MAQHGFTNRNGRAIGVGVLALSGVIALGARTHAKSETAPTSAATLAGEALTGEAVPTFTKDVAPILQQKCQVCHRPGSIAPMSLLSYQDAREAAPDIRDRVGAREMPPWHLDKTAGIQAYQNDRSLSDAQINTLISWIDGGMPEGNKADMPAPVTWGDDAAWGLAEGFGPPDLILKSTPYSVLAQGEDKWWRPTTPTGLTEQRWVRAIEIKPSHNGRAVVHHTLTTLVQNEGDRLIGLASTAAARTGAGLFMEWSVGKTGEIFPENSGKLMMPGSSIRWEVHYHSVGKAVPDDQVELGIWLYPKGYTPKYRTILNLFAAAPGEQLDIPPNAQTVQEDFTVLQAPARIENFQPHMHMRGKGMSMTALYPDGREELLSIVNNFQWNWHVNYIFADSVKPLLPKGTILKFTSWHDNTTANKNNPDPNQWIGYGDRTVDEMAHAWVDITYLEQDDFDRMVAERVRSRPGAGGRGGAAGAGAGPAAAPAAASGSGAAGGGNLTPVAPPNDPTVGHDAHDMP